ncbi:cytochrome o ubiquinol oxidase subunit IV [Thorsellia anophelis]|uniref:Cytochrome bo(3) ubiquinol oxidase subunit 4 n=1 Tax=Thorsellia anophelis DSM 18579 TaxID=1123402 RepID=A0A1I0DEG4_9GAMM|nr:cytochrome o ubiquinol oxidase subunit IV [Thorsellia anophelis]SET30522.1 cytochrome o ubiquinol oxidase operon protein cyoD [Thorsellia anophelis DSM 18579]
MSGHESHAAHYHGTMKSYVIGFVLAVILTAIPFYVVMNMPNMVSSTKITIVAVCAAIQMVVHIMYFLHINTSKEQRWNFISMIYTIIVIGIIVVGSIWVLFGQHENMMLS